MFNLVLIPKIGLKSILSDQKSTVMDGDGWLSMAKLFLGPFVAQQDGGEVKEASR